VLPPKYQRGGGFAFAEGAEALRLFWHIREQYFCRQSPRTRPSSSAVSPTFPCRSNSHSLSEDPMSPTRRAGKRKRKKYRFTKEDCQRGYQAALAKCSSRGSYWLGSVTVCEATTKEGVIPCA